MDINKIHTDELLTDKAAAFEDYLLCELAIERGITEYSGGKVSDRLERNQEVIDTIDAELARRNGGLNGSKL